MELSLDIKFKHCKTNQNLRSEFRLSLVVIITLDSLKEI